MDELERRDALIALWTQWTSNLPKHEHIIGEFHLDVVEPSDIDSDLVNTYRTIFVHLYPED